MSNARDKANIPALNFSSTGIDDNATSTAITIDSAESLGLGTTSPFNSRPGSFTISNEVPTIYMEDTNSSGSGVGQILYSNGDLAYSTGTRNGTGTSNSTEHFRIKNDGKIGIGTGSPGVTLDVNSSTQTTLLHLNSTAGTSSAITFANTGSNDSIAISSENDDLKLRTDDGVIKFFTNENSEKMRIDSSGNVGIGTSSPDASTYFGGKILHIADSSNAGIMFNRTSSTAAKWSVGCNSGGNLDFVKENSVKMRIASDGVVGIGTTSPSSSYRLSVVGGTGAAVGAFIETTSTNSGHEASIIKRPNSGTLVQFLGSGQVGSITTNGSATTYGTSSDYRLKENVVDLNNATERLKQLQPKRFNFISDADTTVDGFIAHEVSSVVPEAIHGTKDEVDADGNPKYQNIDQSKLVPLLVKTIQELEARITTLENA